MGVYKQNYDKLKNHMKYDGAERKVTHNNFKSSPLLPFQTRHPERVKFDNGFNSILGEFTRIELNKSLVENFEMNQIITDIVNNNHVEIDGDENVVFLEKLLKEYLFTENGDLNILTPYLFSYIPLSDNRQYIGEKDIAQFLRDIFCQNNEELVDFFGMKKSSHPVINLILKNIPPLDDKVTDVKYQTVIPEIVELFNEDIQYALSHKKFLINDISNIFAYYYFFYASQLVLKLSKGINQSDEPIDQLYYILDWENVSKNRKSINGYGWELLRNNSYTLAAWVSVVDQLNILFGFDDYLLLDNLFNEFKKLSLENQEEFLYFLKEWVGNYRSARGFDDEPLPYEFSQLVEILYKSLNDEKGIGVEIRTSRYPLNLEEIAKAFFVKGRGKYGLVLNITREMLLTLTTLCVKDKQIKLNQLFKEYEKRGLYFDKYSREEIEIFLTKLNLIEKKSDSGDAKYVKPVLQLSFQ